jgi:Tfp pilus assembly protein PilF
MREVALVGEARSAIVRGEAASALALLDAADQSKSRSLQPEELALRARAFRALGRSAEAMQVEEQLRTRYPDSFLAR